MRDSKSEPEFRIGQGGKEIGGFTPWQPEFSRKHRDAGYWFGKTIISPVKVSVTDVPAPVRCHSETIRRSCTRQFLSAGPRQRAFSPKGTPQGIVDYPYSTRFHIAPPENVIQPHHRDLYEVCLDLLRQSHPETAIQGIAGMCVEMWPPVFLPSQWPATILGRTKEYCNA